jgi:hypothetical protein
VRTAGSEENAARAGSNSLRLQEEPVALTRRRPQRAIGCRVFCGTPQVENAMTPVCMHIHQDHRQRCHSEWIGLASSRLLGELARSHREKKKPGVA